MATIRLARLEELETVYGLVQEAIRHMDEQGIPQWDDVYPSKAILNADIENRQMYLIEVEGRVAGFTVINEDQSPEYSGVAWKHDGRALVVHRLTIHPDYQRRKLASYLMDFAEEMASTEDYDCVRLDAFTRNPAAYAMYEKRGYRRAGIVRFRKGDFFCYEKKISGEGAIRSSKNRHRRIADKSGRGSLGFSERTNMRTHVEFRSSKFPAYSGEEEKVNPGLWGKRLAEYLFRKLREERIETEEIYPEDWGWVVPIHHEPFSLWVGCGHYEEYPDGYLVFIEPSKPTIRKALFKKIDTTRDVEKVAAALDRILKSDPKISNVRWWAEDEK